MPTFTDLDDKHWVEVIDSSTFGQQSYTSGRATRTFFVKNLAPVVAYEEAIPPLPRIGDLFPRVAQTQTSISRSDTNIPEMRAETIQRGWMAGSLSHSVVSIGYSSGPDKSLTSTGKRKVLYEIDVATTSRQVTHDVDGNPLPSGGTTIETPLITYNAIMEDAQLSNPAQSSIGKLNFEFFFGWPPGIVKFAGIQTRLKQGTSVQARGGLGEITFQFVANPNGWGVSFPRLDELGKKIPGELDVFDVIPLASFRNIWPANWEPGAFFDRLDFPGFVIPGF